MKRQIQAPSWSISGCRGRGWPSSHSRSGPSSPPAGPVLLLPQTPQRFPCFISDQKIRERKGKKERKGSQRLSKFERHHGCQREENVGRMWGKRKRKGKKERKRKSVIDHVMLGKDKKGRKGKKKKT
jgi:hypothetical protein